MDGWEKVNKIVYKNTKLQKKMLNNIMVTSLATQFIWKITESDYTLMALSSFFVSFLNKVANYKRILIMIIIKLSFPYSDDNKFSIPQHQKPQQKQQAKMQCRKWEPTTTTTKKLWAYVIDVNTPWNGFSILFYNHSVHQINNSTHFVKLLHLGNFIRVQ